MTHTIQNQIEASGKSADEIEHLINVRSPIALLAFDLTDLLSFVVSIYHNIGDGAERFRLKDDATKEEILGRCGQWMELYKMLESKFQQVAPLIKKLESAGGVIEGKEPFFAAWRKLRAHTAFPIETTLLANQQAERGELKSLEEVSRELLGSTND